MSSRWTGFFVWALVAASAAFWGFKVFAAARPLPPGAQAPQVAVANGPMERLFGAVVVPTAAAAPVHPESERYQLVGVIAPRDAAARGGFAILSLDNQPARTWRVGSTIDGDTTLISVSKRGAEFGPQGGPAAFTLQLPEPNAAETGTIAPAVSRPDAAQLQLQQSPHVENSQHVAQPPAFGFQGGGMVRSALPQPPEGRNGPRNVVPPQPQVDPAQLPPSEGGGLQK